VFRERTGPSVLQHGLARPGTVTVAATIDAAGDGWFCGLRQSPSSMFALVAGTEFEFIAPRGLDIVALCIDRDFLERYAARVEPASAPNLPARSGVLATHPTLATQFRQLMLGAMATAREMSPLLDVAAMRRGLQFALCDAMLESLRDGTPAELESLAPQARLGVVRQARAFIAAHAGESITVPDLCEAVKVSRRTLQYCFQIALGMSPVTYLRIHRLNGVRHELRRGDAAAAPTVAEAAARWGFWHLSRFAADYHRFFGELPSDTRRHARGA